MRKLVNSVKKVGEDQRCTCLISDPSGSPLMFLDDSEKLRFQASHLRIHPSIVRAVEESTKSSKNQVEKKRFSTKKTNLAVRKRRRYGEDRRKTASPMENREAVATDSSGALSCPVIDAGDGGGGDQTGKEVAARLRKIIIFFSSPVSWLAV